MYRVKSPGCCNQQQCRSVGALNVVTFCGLLALILSGCVPINRQTILAEGFAAVQRGDGRMALEIFESIAQCRPDTMEGVLAVDAGIEVSGHRLFPERSQ